MARLKPKAPFEKRHIFDAVINEWIAAARDSRDVNGDNIKLVLETVLDFTDPHGRREIDIVVDSNAGGRRVHHLSVPLPEPPGDLIDWINQKYPNAASKDGLADAILFGCGR